MSERQVKSGVEAGASPDGLHASAGAITRWLIRHAAQRAPPDLAERLEEEWRADLAERPSALSRLRFALGCCWATRVIAREHQPATAPVASPAMGPKVTLGFARDQPSFFARRSITFFLVAGLHIALFYALMTGLTIKIFKVVPTPFHVRLVTPQPTRSVPLLPPPQLTRPIIVVPLPDFPPTEGLVEDRAIVADPYLLAASRSDAPPEAPPRDVVRVQGGPGNGFPTTDEYYPSIAKRLEEQGVATVRVCVGADGRLTAIPTIAQTSGSPRLDDGALLLAKAGSGHYRPATEDGRAVNSCYPFRVRFAFRTER